MLRHWYLLMLLTMSLPLQAVPTDDIMAVIRAQEQAWNQEDLDAYMKGYWNSPKLRFVSAGKFNYGWQEILAAYKRNYPNAQSLGKLSFTVKEIRMLSNYSALVVGRWQLKRVKDAPSGVFTLLIEKMDGKWVITHDHSSD
ncbi:MAG: YybH family protein [Shewanella sp.]